MTMTIRTVWVTLAVLMAVAVLILANALGAGRAQDLRTPTHDPNKMPGGKVHTQQVPFHDGNKAPRNQMVPYTSGN